MDEPHQPPPYRTPPWYCCSFENYVVIFSPFTSDTILSLIFQSREVLPDGQRALSTHKAQCSGEGAAGTMISPLPRGC